MWICRLVAILVLCSCLLPAQYTPAPIPDGGKAAYMAGLEHGSKGEKKLAIQAYRAAAKAGHEAARGMLIVYLRNGTIEALGELTDYERTLMNSANSSGTTSPANSAERSDGTPSSSSSNPKRWPWVNSVFKTAGLHRLSERELDVLNSYIDDLVNRAIQHGGKQSSRAPVLPSAGSGEAFESQIDGDFEGWEGETVFKLMNGQIWIQDEFAFTYTYHFMPKVLIYRIRGEWRMKVEDMNETIRVRRLR